MPKRTPLPPETLKAAACLFASGKPSRRKAVALGVPGKRYPAMAKAAAEELEAFKIEVGGTLRRTVAKIAKRLDEETGNLPIGQAAVNLGILLDKERLLREASTNPQSLHLHIKGDASSALTAILGPAAALVLRPPKPEPVDVTPEPTGDPQ